MSLQHVVLKQQNANTKENISTTTTALSPSSLLVLDHLEKTLDSILHLHTPEAEEKRWIIATLACGGRTWGWNPVEILVRLPGGNRVTTTRNKLLQSMWGMWVEWWKNRIENVLGGTLGNVSSARERLSWVKSFVVPDTAGKPLEMFLPIGNMFCHGRNVTRGWTFLSFPIGVTCCYLLLGDAVVWGVCSGLGPPEGADPAQICFLEPGCRAPVWEEVLGTWAGWAGPVPHPAALSGVGKLTQTGQVLRFLPFSLNHRFSHPSNILFNTMAWRTEKLLANCLCFWLSLSKGRVGIDNVPGWTQ